MANRCSVFTLNIEHPAPRETANEGLQRGCRRITEQSAMQGTQHKWSRLEHNVCVCFCTSFNVIILLFIVNSFRVRFNISKVDYSIALRVDYSKVCYFYYSFKPEEMSQFSKLDPNECCPRLCYYPKVVLLLWSIYSSHQLGETLQKVNFPAMKLI